MQRQKGFTLIELMIVIAIIGILAIIAIPRFVDLVDKAREGATKGNIGAIRGALVIYYGDNEGNYPASLDEYTNNEAWRADLQYCTPPFSAYIEGGELPDAQLRRRASASLAPGGAITSNKCYELPSCSNQGGWWWDSVGGRVRVNSWVGDTKGTPYCTTPPY